MRIEGVRADGLLKLHLAAGVIVLLGDDGRKTGPLTDKQADVYGPWQAAPNTLTDRRQAEFRLARAVMAPTETFAERIDLDWSKWDEERSHGGAAASLRNIHSIWTAKAEAWNEATLVTSPKAIAAANTLTHVPFDEIYKNADREDGKITPQTSFDEADTKRLGVNGPNETPNDMLFVIERRDGARWLVNTEGYDYARYIARLPPLKNT